MRPTETKTPKLLTRLTRSASAVCDAVANEHGEGAALFVIVVSFMLVLVLAAVLAVYASIVLAIMFVGGLLYVGSAFLYYVLSGILTVIKRGETDAE